jgi:GT2 family glycosyltransferase
MDARSPSDPPADVAALLAERDIARGAADWARADALRNEIRALGWDPIDGRAGSTARPWLPEAPSEVAYLPPGGLASLLDEPPTVALSIVVTVDDHPEDYERLAAALARTGIGPDGELVVVANQPREPIAERVDSLATTVLRTSQRLGWADAVNLGLRRSRGAVIVLLDTSLEPTGDWITPLTAAFDAPEVGIAGGWGVSSRNGREFSDAPPGEVDAVEGYCLAIRRAALRGVGGFDRRFRWYRNADLDLSFALRDAGWRAIRTEPLPMVRHEHRGWNDLAPEERDRLSKRNFYRFLDHWGDRRDLLLHPDPPARD